MIKIPILPNEAVHMKPSEGPCEVHDWPLDGLAKRLVKTMRERHGKGGLNVCVDCIERARDQERKEHPLLVAAVAPEPSDALVFRRASTTNEGPRLFVWLSGSYTAGARDARLRDGFARRPITGCSLEDWENTIVPALTSNTPRADGTWSVTHAIEVLS